MVLGGDDRNIRNVPKSPPRSRKKYTTLIYQALIHERLVASKILSKFVKFRIQFLPLLGKNDMIICSDFILIPIKSLYY